jgi:cysteine desulfurase
MNSTARCYFDHSATTPVDPRVIGAMEPFLHDGFGNPSSMYQEGVEAHQALEEAREKAAALFGARPGEVVFTASGTEADNLALRGAIPTPVTEPTHLITAAFEHPAILEVCRYLEKHGVSITFLSVGNDGFVDPQELRRAMRPNTKLVSIMAANNVVGTIQPVAELASVAHEHGALFHTDAVQAAGKLPIDIGRDGIDLLSFSAHKIHGPKGVGALIVRHGLELQPLILGGGQERGIRSGTENVAGIVGLGRAAEIARAEMAQDSVRLVSLRDQLIDGIEERIPNAYVIGHRFRRLPGHICLGISGLEGETVKLLLALNQAGIAVSTGSACSSHHAGEPSHVLLAMGFDAFRARGSVRITLGRFTTSAQVDYLLEVLPLAVRDLQPIASCAGRS